LSSAPATTQRPDAEKNALKPHLEKQWVIQPEANAAFVAAMEDVLEVYQRPRDPNRPLVCLDETTRVPIRPSLHSPLATTRVFSGRPH
jgi:hypothetical protein